MKRKSGEGGGPVMKVQEVGYFFFQLQEIKGFGEAAAQWAEGEGEWQAGVRCLCFRGAFS